MLSTRLVRTRRSVVGISFGASRKLPKRPVPPTRNVPPATVPSFRNSRRRIIVPLHLTRECPLGLRRQQHCTPQDLAESYLCAAGFETGWLFEISRRTVSR